MRGGPIRGPSLTPETSAVWAGVGIQEHPTLSVSTRSQAPISPPAALIRCGRLALRSCSWPKMGLHARKRPAALRSLERPPLSFSAISNHISQPLRHILQTKSMTGFEVLDKGRNVSHKGPANMRVAEVCTVRGTNIPIRFGALVLIAFAI